MIARLMNIRGALRFVFFDTNGEGLPISERRGAYRRSIYPNRNPAGSAVRAAAWSNELPSGGNPGEKSAGRHADHRVTTSARSSECGIGGQSVRRVDPISRAGGQQLCPGGAGDVDPAPFVTPRRAA